MSIKQLALAQSPIVGLQYISYPLNILLNYEECRLWFHGEYIQLAWYKDLKPLFTFANKLFSHNPTLFPCLQSQVFSRAFLAKCDMDMHKLIINAIDDGWYIYSSFDEYLVPHRPFYKNEHFDHDFLLYGYDLKNKQYYLYGYTDRRIIESTSISFKQFKDAYTASMNTQVFGYRNLILLKKADNFKYEFDQQLFYDSLIQYLNSKNPYERFQEFDRESEKVYGIEIYDYLIKYFDSIPVNVVNDVALDIRPLHILWEHKKCMVLRLKYLKQNKILDFDESIISSYETIEKIAFTTRNLQIKYGTLHRSIILDKIKNNLIQLKAFEKDVLEKLIT